MYILNLLIDFYSSRKAEWLAILLVSWLVFPGMVFIVGGIFESRLVPIFRQQSRAFIPGDLVFGIIFVNIIGIYAKIYTGQEIVLPPKYCIVWATIAVLMAGLAINLRITDGANYPARSRYSPTKITHDLLGYYLVPVMLIGLVAMLLMAVSIDQLFKQYWQNMVIILICILFYAGCAIIDIRDGYSYYDLIMRHPTDWKPIWTLKSH